MYKVLAEPPVRVQSLQGPGVAHCSLENAAQSVRELDVPSSWLQRLSSPGGASARLVCFPHAGGSAAFFRSWQEALPPFVELLGVQYPGRGTRLREAPVDRVFVMARAVAHAMRALPGLPTVLFGHSLGGAVAFETVRCLAEDGAAPPGHLFVSSRAAPHLVSPRPTIAHLPDLDFLREVGRRYAAVPSELLQYPDVVSLLVPGLRADLAAIEHYEGTEAGPTNCSITAIGGLNDPITTQDDLMAWQDLTSRRFQMRMFPGGHFYLEGERVRLVAEIVAVLKASVDTILLNGSV